MKHKFIMMGIEAGLFDVAPAGSVSQLLSATRHSSLEESLMNTALIKAGANISQPTLPRCTFIQYLACIYNVPDSNGLAGKNKRHLQEFTNLYTQDKEKEGNHNYPKWGFDRRCLDTV